MILPFLPGPNPAFVVTFAGALLLYGELLLPGKIVPGVVGALMSMSGIYWLARMQPTGLGLSLLAGALLCFSLEARFRTFFLAGAAATALLACASWRLFSQPARIVTGLAFPVSALFGIITVGLLNAAKRARSNKRADL